MRQRASTRIVDLGQMSNGSHLSQGCGKPNMIGLTTAPMLLGLMIAFSSCGRTTGTEEENGTVPGPDLPAVRYVLGDRDLDEILATLVKERGSGTTTRIHEHLASTKALFHDGHGPEAWAEILLVLGEGAELDTTAIDQLIRSEALHQAARSFFYQLETSFEPARSLLDSAMRLTHSLIRHPDERIQQTALYQLAQHYDVLQGLTYRHGTHIAMPQPDEFTHASRVALRIKTELLGLSGPPILRSLSNLGIDLNWLCIQGNDAACSEHDSVISRSFKELDALTQETLVPHGEFAAAVATRMFWISSARSDIETMRRALEWSLRIGAGDRHYALDHPAPKLSGNRGAQHFLYQLPEMVGEYSRMHVDSILHPLARHLEQQMDSAFRASFVRASLHEQKTWAQLTVKEKTRANELFTRQQLPVIGEPAYQEMLTQISRSEMQARNTVTDQRIASRNPRFAAQRDSLMLVDAELRREARNFMNEHDPSAAITCSRLVTERTRLRRALNEQRVHEIRSDRALSLPHLRSKLGPDGCWLSIVAGNSRWTLCIVTDDGAKLDTVMMESTLGSEGTKRKDVLQQLQTVITSGSTWTLDHQARMKGLAMVLFSGKGLDKAKHIVISSFGQFRSSILEPLLLAYFEELHEQDLGHLGSIRFDQTFHLVKHDSLTSKGVEVVAIAPDFSDPPPPVITATTSYDILDRLGRSNHRSMLGKLQYNVDEARNIQAITGGRTLLDSEANEPRFRDFAINAGVLHFATHSVVELDNVDAAGILLSKDWHMEDLREMDNVLRVQEIRRLSLTADLVVLSACETSTSPSWTSGYESSIAMAFREAGCSNLLTTQWKVDDKATHDIIIEFYRELKAERGKAEALFEAKRRYRMAHPGASPHYWAAFTLVGDNRPVRFAPTN